MFQIGDRIRVKDSSLVNEDELRIVWFNDGLYRLDGAENYIIQNINNGHKEYIRGEDMLPFDENYYRRKKLDKICSKLKKI